MDTVVTVAFRGCAVCSQILFVTMLGFLYLAHIPSVSCLYSLGVMVPVLPQRISGLLFQPSVGHRQDSFFFVCLTLQLGETLPRILKSPVSGRLDLHFTCLLSRTGYTNVCAFGGFEIHWFRCALPSASATTFFIVLPPPQPGVYLIKVILVLNNWSRVGSLDKPSESAADLLCTPLSGRVLFSFMWSRVVSSFHHTPSSIAWTIAVTDFQGQLWRDNWKSCWCYLSPFLVSASKTAWN